MLDFSKTIGRPGCANSVFLQENNSVELEAAALRTGWGAGPAHTGPQCPPLPGASPIQPQVMHSHHLPHSLGVSS